MDFMNVSNSFPVEYRLVELEDRVTCYAKGSRWAEPSVEHAAELMRFVFDHPEEAAKRGEVARQEIASNFSDEAVGRLLKERIQLISNGDRFREMKERLAGPAGNTPAFVEEFSDLGPYVPSEHLSYLDLKSTLRGSVRQHVPRHAVLAVVSKGDEDLLQLHEGSACHFPADPSGKYAGYYPEDSVAAIREVKTLQAEEGHFLLFPRTAFWWLEHYSELNRYLHQECRLTHSDEFCRIFEIPSAREKQWEVA